MHGRPRKPPTKEELDASALKADKLRLLQSQFLHFHHNKIFTKEATEISAKLLELNPEYYTGWNYRKLAIQHFLQLRSENAGEIVSTMDEELKVVEIALRTNIKSYGAWHHRKWVLTKGHSLLDKEMHLLGKFQKLDARNFHAWNYRRFVTSLKKTKKEEELKYVTDMINDNFSNYSAWHNRSVLLSQLLEERIEENPCKEDVLQEEYDIVRHSFFTDPDDQSGWFYHLWLLNQTGTVGTKLLSSWPPHGSKLLSRDYVCDDQRSFPFILYFTEPVRGVSCSTVGVECEYLTNNELVWRPLSTNKSGFAQAWLTYLKFPDAMHTLDACTVKVTVAQRQGIISVNGTFCTQCTHVSFTVHLPSPYQDYFEEKFRSRIYWNEENFNAYSNEPHDPNLPQSFCTMETPGEGPKYFEWSMRVIAKEIEYCRELLSLTECKIGKLTLARLLMAKNTLISHPSHNNGSEVNYDEILALYGDLILKDAAHICYYEDKRSLVLLKQMTSNVESLAKHCLQYMDSTSPNYCSHSCLRLTGLSLSRIGCMEHLLWVQMLDLSHNKLHSIEGLEALQLLSCLNLSHNKICSFSSLEPLKLLKSLKVLDISYNEIGDHSIDTRRYLFSSPLNHTLGSDCSAEISSLDCWDSFLIFEDLNLIQLDIVGNAVVDELLKASIVKSIPSLKWLDGENCH